jgi:hypothetical protein
MFLLRVALGTLILAAAGSGRAEAAPAGISRLDDLAVGHHECPGGGAALRVGIDRDHDGVFSSNEHVGGEYLCTQAPPRMLIGNAGHPSLLGHCPTGGIALPIGLDLDRDRQLERHELERVVYACNQPRAVPRPAGGPPFVVCGAANRGRAPGPAAIADSGELPPLAQAVVRRNLEPAGDRCPHGGAGVLTGLDLDRDGILDDREVEQTAYACRPVPALAPLRVRFAPAGSDCATLIFPCPRFTSLPEMRALGPSSRVPAEARTSPATGPSIDTSPPATSTWPATGPRITTLPPATLRLPPMLAVCEISTSPPARRALWPMAASTRTLPPAA